MNNKESHFIIITEHIIKDIEEISKVPDEHKKTLKNLFLSENKYDKMLGKEIIKILFPDKSFIFVETDNLFNHPLSIKDITRHINLIIDNR